MEIKLCFKLNSRLLNNLIVCQCSTYSKYVDRAKSGRLNFENDFRNNHIETSTFQKVLLGLGSGFMSITDPRRGDMVAVMGESTGAHAFEYIRSKMVQSEEGKQILQDKPRISSGGVDLEKLEQMPEGTLGKAYSNFLARYKYSPDSRLAVRFVDDMELAYVAQRYREAHDLFHTILNMPTNMLGEVTVKWVEAIQTRLPMCITGALFGPLRLAPKFTRTYTTKPAVLLDPQVLEKLNNGIKVKHHPGKVIRKTVFLPECVEETIISLLGDNKAICTFKQAKKERTSFYRRSIPKEGQTKDIMVHNFKISILNKLNKNEKLSDTVKDDILNYQMKRYERILNANSKQVRFDRKTSLIYLAARVPYEYASLVNIFTEISGIDPDFVPNKVFDFGSGVGTVTWAASKVWGPRITEFFTVDTSKEINNLAISIIELNKVKLSVKNYLQRQFLSASEEEFDIVVCAFSLSHMKNFQDRMEKLDLLWKKAAKYLVIVENGTLDGFTIITEARQFILQEATGHSFNCHVAAPCPHDFVCPKVCASTKKVCSFLAKYRDLRTTKIEEYGATPYSYVVFKKGKRSEEDKQWPRVLSEPILNKRHVVCNLCTSEGKLAHITITKAKHGGELYRCVRSSEWGDRLPAEIRLNPTEE